MAESNVEKKVMAELMSVLGPNGWIKAEDAQSWSRDWLDRFGERPLGVARPITTAEISAVLRVCYDAGIPIVPQGGNTGLVGASVLDRPGGIILSFGRMNKIISKDRSSRTVVVEPGVVLANLHNALDGTGLIFPMHLGSQGTAQIGGLIATNAGGSHAFRFGMMQDLVIGLEVVLANGSIWNGLRQVQKDNTGYQLRKLFCGSEGTIGVVSKAVLKLSTKPKQVVCALLSIPGETELIEATNHLRSELDDFLTAIEFFSDIGVGFAVENIPNLPFPFADRAPYYLLVEAGTANGDLALERLVSDQLAVLISKSFANDCLIAMSESQRVAFWRLREEQPEGQRLHGRQIKNDLSVPPGRLGEFLARAQVICDNILPGLTINPFGHMGDGNVHYNLSPPREISDFAGRDDEIVLALSRLASELDGSFAAEHGLGLVKRDIADYLRSPEERDIAKKIKTALDSRNQLNPNVITRA